MKITMAKSELDRALGLTARIAARASVAYMACVLIEAEGDAVSISATDQDESAMAKASALVEEPGRSLVPAARLAAVVRQMPDAAVTVESDGETARVRCGRSRSSMPALDPLDFPSFPTVSEGERMEIAGSDLADAVKACGPFASRKDGRPSLTCINVEAHGDAVEFQASDSYRIVAYRTAASSPDGFSCAIPRSLLETVVEAAGSGNVAITAAKSLVRTECEGFVGTMRRVDVDSKYPDVGRFFEREPETTATVKREDLLAMTRRCIASTSMQSYPVRIEISGSEVIARRDGDERERFEESMEAEVEGAGDHVSLSPHYLADCAKSIPSDVVALGLCGPLAPSIISGGAATCVVMPVRERG